MQGETSLPSWERGLKCAYTTDNAEGMVSLPSWERGLKCAALNQLSVLKFVAPFVGAWIEIVSCVSSRRHGLRRSLRGSVD